MSFDATSGSKTTKTTSNPDTAVEDGVGGGELAILSGSTISADDIDTTTVISYTNSSSTPFEKVFPVASGDKNNPVITESPTEVEDGIGGGELAILSGEFLLLSDIDTSVVSNWSNRSSTPVEPTIVANSGEKQESQAEEPDIAATDGEGGGLITFLLEGKTFQGNVIRSMTANFFFNESSVPVVGQVVEQSGDLTDKSTHASVTSDVRDSNREPIEGELSATLNGATIFSETVTGRTSFGLPIPPYITDGEEAPSTGLVYSIEFSPSAGGPTVVESSLEGNTTLNTVYKDITGLVQSNDERPLSNETVLLGDYSTSTDPAGEFTALVPLGEGFRAVSLSGTSVRDITVEEGDSGEYAITFTYCGLEVTVSKPNGAGISGAKVTYGPYSMETDEQGIATDTTLPLGNYTVRLFGYYESDIIANEEGSSFTLQLGGGDSDFIDPQTGEIVDNFDSLTVTALDSVSDEAVSNVDLLVPGSAVKQSTGQGGQATVVVPPSLTAQAPTGAEYVVEVGKQDNRYTLEEANGTVGQGDSQDTVNLERKEQVSQV